MDPSSPPGPEFGDEADVLLGNNDGAVEDEEEGEELFGDNFERYVFSTDSRPSTTFRISSIM